MSWGGVQAWYEALKPGDKIAIHGTEYIKPDQIHPRVEHCFMVADTGQFLHFSHIVDPSMVRVLGLLGCNHCGSLFDGSNICADCGAIITEEEEP